MTSQESDEEYLDDPIKLIDFEQRRVGEQNSFHNKKNADEDYDLVDSDGEVLIEKEVKRVSRAGVTLPVTFFDNARNTKLFRECCPLSIKVIDCNKHSWYYKNNSTLKINTVLSSTDCPRNKESGQDFEQNLEDMNDESSKFKIRPVSTPYNNLKVDVVKSKTQPAKKFFKKQEDWELLKMTALKLRNIVNVDLKLNQGLIGLRITNTQENLCLKTVPKREDAQVINNNIQTGNAVVSKQKDSHSVNKNKTDEIKQKAENVVSSAKVVDPGKAESGKSPDKPNNKSSKVNELQKNSELQKNNEPHKNNEPRKNNEPQKNIEPSNTKKPQKKKKIQKKTCLNEHNNTLENIQLNVNCQEKYLVGMKIKKNTEYNSTKSKETVKKKKSIAKLICDVANKSKSNRIDVTLFKKQKPSELNTSKQTLTTPAGNKNEKKIPNIVEVSPVVEENRNKQFTNADKIQDEIKQKTIIDSKKQNIVNVVDSTLNTAKITNTPVAPPRMSFGVINVKKTITPNRTDSRPMNKQTNMPMVGNHQLSSYYIEKSKAADMPTLTNMLNSNPSSFLNRQNQGHGQSVQVQNQSPSNSCILKNQKLQGIRNENIADVMAFNTQKVYENNSLNRVPVSTLVNPDKQLAGDKMRHPSISLVSRPENMPESKGQKSSVPTSLAQTVNQAIVHPNIPFTQSVSRPDGYGRHNLCVSSAPIRQSKLAVNNKMPKVNKTVPNSIPTQRNMLHEINEHLQFQNVNDFQNQGHFISTMVGRRPEASEIPMHPLITMQNMSQQVQNVNHIPVQNYMHCAPIYEEIPQNLNFGHQMPFPQVPWGVQYPLPPPPPPPYPRTSAPMFRSNQPHSNMQNMSHPPPNIIKSHHPNMQHPNLQHPNLQPVSVIQGPNQIVPNSNCQLSSVTKGSNPNIQHPNMPHPINVNKGPHHNMQNSNLQKHSVSNGANPNMQHPPPLQTLNVNKGPQHNIQNSNLQKPSVINGSNLNMQQPNLQTLSGTKDSNANMPNSNFQTSKVIQSPNSNMRKLDFQHMNAIKSSDAKAPSPNLQPSNATKSLEKAITQLTNINQIPSPGNKNASPSLNSIRGATVIGQNNSGPIRKINITAVPSSSHVAERDIPVNSKKEMLQELSKTSTGISPPASPLKRAYPINNTTPVLDKLESQSKRPRPGPLSKKFQDSPGSTKPVNPAMKTADVVPELKAVIAHKGYSPPILPIPTYEKTFEILAKANIGDLMRQNSDPRRPDSDSLKQTVNNLDKPCDGQTRRNDKIIKRRLAMEEEKQDKAMKKISLDEYKKRIPRNDDKNEDLSDHIKKEFKTENPESDLGYDSDSTIKL